MHFLYNKAMFTPLNSQLSTVNYIRLLSSVISGGENLKNITIFFVVLENSCNFDLSV